MPLSSSSMVKESGYRRNFLERTAQAEKAKVRSLGSCIKTTTTKATALQLVSAGSSAGSSAQGFPAQHLRQTAATSSQALEAMPLALLKD